MIKENKRSGWALAGVILTGLLVISNYNYFSFYSF